MSWVFIATTAFLSECAPQQAAGAFALGNMLRNPGAAIAAVILPPLVSRMGIGWFFTGLGLLDLVVVGGAVIGKQATIAGSDLSASAANTLSDPVY